MVFMKIKMFFYKYKYLCANKVNSNYNLLTISIIVLPVKNYGMHNEERGRGKVNTHRA